MNRSLFLLIVVFFVAGAVQSCAAQEKFTNPILAGFYPDPSICKVGSDYYLVNSTFSYFPGIPVFHSTDLVNWKLIGHVMNRPEQLNLAGQGVSRGLFAPSIRYHNGLFYVTCTLVDIGGNFVVTAEKPEGPWSNPAWLPEINGIDPSMFFDDDGKGYVLYNSIAPDDRPLYDGHRTIRIREIDLTTLKLTGNEEILVNGGTDIGKKPVWIESPHILKKEGFYYLIAAEGGTGENHSVVVFRSEEVRGPYLPYSGNPILTQRNLNPKRDFPITCTGHADLVQNDAGQWWAVFLGCRPYRPYEENFYNIGRETFLAPVRWTDGWPVINPDYAEVQYRTPVPIAAVHAPADHPYSGNFSLWDNFTGGKLGPDWVFLRTPMEKWYTLDSIRGGLTISLRPATCSGTDQPGFLARRQQHHDCSAAVSMNFRPGKENEKAGLAIFQNETHYYYLCMSLKNGNPDIQLYKSMSKPTATAAMELIASDKPAEDKAWGDIILKIEEHGGVFSFSYSTVTDKWKTLGENVDATFLSTRTAGGFVGSMFALYATSLGEPSTCSAVYHWFEYRGNDEVYK